MMTAIDDYWTEEAQLGEGTFSYYHDEPRPIMAQVHISEGPYTFVNAKICLTQERP